MKASLSIWYAVSVAAISLNPWLGVLLVDAGMTDARAATALLAVPVGRLIGGPFWSWIADRVRARQVLLGTTALSALVAATLLLPLPPWGMAAAIGLFAVARSPVFPIADATTLKLLGAGYGPIRAIGSAAFLVAVLAGGVLRDEVHGSAPVMLAVGLLVATALASTAFPEAQAPAAPPDLRAAGRLLVQPTLMPIFVACVLHGASLSAYDQLFSVHIDQLGLPATTTGAALATGVAVEVAVLATGPWWVRRVGARTLFLVGLAAGVPRFVLTGTVTDPTALIAIQALHGLHFGAYWMGAVVLVSSAAPRGLENTAQALLPAATFGAGALLGLGAAAVLLRGDGDVALLYRVLAGASALATVVALFTRRESRSRRPA